MNDVLCRVGKGGSTAFPFSYWLSYAVPTRSLRDQSIHDRVGTAHESLFQW
jgi:hypothetical protein